MAYELLLGDRAYSSWSMRAGLLVERFGLPVQIRWTTMYTEGFRADIAAHAPARTVPALRLPEGPVIAESSAIAEELASRFPQAGLWPAAPGARAVARALTAEMHAGFAPLRRHCPMNLRIAYTAPVPDEVAADLARLETLWGWARETTAAPGPWLCGDYGIVDAFFAPVVARIAGYGLPVGPVAEAYAEAHLADGAFRAWHAAAQREGPDQRVYDRDWPRRPWPI